MAIISVIGGVLYQWDTSRELRINLPDDVLVTRIDYATCAEKLLSVKVKNEEGVLTADIPNIFLQETNDITAYVVIKCSGGERTIAHRVFEVEAKEKPPGYVHEETEVLTWTGLDERLNHLEELLCDSSLRLSDEATSKFYELKVTNGKLTMEEVIEQ